jgi:hypothetical protein
MTAISLGMRRTTGSASGLTARALLAYGLGGAVALLFVTQITPPSLILLLAGALFIATGIWMFRSERYEHTLAVLMVYLGMADGYLKLRTGSSVMTLGRDALLYAIVLGAMIRWIVRHEKAGFPPMTGWILVFAGLVIAEIFNPGTGPLKHGLPAVRPDLEFVPLFFFGYVVMRSRQRMRGFLVILLFICAANGIVSLIQFRDTPAQVAAWGPGYAQKVNGTAGVSGRVFTDSSGTAHVRPFGLQSDAGGGGNTGMLGVAAAIALLGPLRSRRWRGILLAGVLAAGTVLAVVTSDGRGALVASFAALFAYIGLSVVSKRLIPTLGGLVVAALVTVLVISFVSSHASNGTLSRYSTIAPTNLVGTYGRSRGFTLSLIPTYARRFPLGAGLGSTGPSSGVGKQSASLDGSTEFTYLLTDVGVLGFIVLLGFHLRMLVLSVRRIRQFLDPQMRALLAALAAPLFGIFALYFGGPATTSSPESPYLWFVAGTLVYWFTKGLRGERERDMIPALSRV